MHATSQCIDDLSPHYDKVYWFIAILSAYIRSFCLCSPPPGPPALAACHPPCPTHISAPPIRPGPVNTQRSPVIITQTLCRLSGQHMLCVSLAACNSLPCYPVPAMCVFITCVFRCCFPQVVTLTRTHPSHHVVCSQAKHCVHKVARHL